MAAASDSDTVARVVVGVDGSASSHRALEWAAFQAAVLDTSIEAVTAWQVPTDYGFSVSPQWDPAVDMRQVLMDSVRTVFGEEPPARLQLAVHEGGAARVLIDASRGAQLLVVGSRGHGGFTGLLLGSVSASVAEHAHCPVLVVHGEQRPPSSPSH